MTESSAPPGFYDDPEQSGKKRWWDGSKWTDVTKSSLEIPDVGTLAGGALIADGIVGFGKNRQGILGSLIGIVVGIGVAVVFGGFLAPQWAADSEISDPVSTVATVVSVERFDSEIVDDDGVSRSGAGSCSVVLDYTTVEGEQVRSGTPFSSSALCAYSPGQEVTIRYDPESVSRFQGLDSTGEQLMAWFPWLFVGAGVLIAVSSFWTFLLRATQIGGGIYLINRSRQKDRERLAKKALRRQGLPPVSDTN